MIFRPEREHVSLPLNAAACLACCAMPQNRTAALRVVTFLKFRVVVFLLSLALLLLLWLAIRPMR